MDSSSALINQIIAEPRGGSFLEQRGGRSGVRTTLTRVFQGLRWERCRAEGCEFTTLTFCSMTTLMSASLSVAASSVCASTCFSVEGGYV